MLWTAPMIKEIYSYSKSSIKYWSEYYGKPVRKVVKKRVKLYFYTNLPEENGGYTTTALGKFTKQTICNNYYKLGRNIYLEGHGKKRVEDRGSKAFNKSDVFDVYIPRRSNETKRQYKNRVNNMGIKYTTAYIIYFK